MDRRSFIRLTAAGLIAPACDAPTTAPTTTFCRNLETHAADDGGSRTAWIPANVPLDDDAFPQGVTSGSMSATAATLWGRVMLEQASSGLRLRVWRTIDGDDATVDLVVDEAVEPTSDSDDTAIASGIVKRRMEGLAPGAEYRYGLFVVDEGGTPIARSSIGRVRTAIADEACAPVTFGATSCTNPRSAPFGCLTQLSQIDADFGALDAVLHVGDMVYADGSRSADAYRGHWRAALADTGYRSLLGHTGLLMAWDDHEFDNNLNPESAPAGLIELAKAALYENLPIERGVGGVDWSSHRFGTAVEVIRLDTRTQRQPSRRSDDASAYLSRAQMEFLKERLAHSPCHFKVVMNSVPMTQMPPLWIQQQDRWQGYAAAREELLVFLEENGLDNVWFISGDFHVGFVARLEPTGFRSRLWEVAVGPGGNLGNPIMAFVQAGQREEVFPRAQFLYGEGKLAATRLRFDPAADAVHIRYTAADGDVLFDRFVSRTD
jgi:phosphodiesterase/alkaline phosphatase D-like protein